MLERRHISVIAAIFAASSFAVMPAQAQAQKPVQAQLQQPVVVAKPTVAEAANKGATEVPVRAATPGTAGGGTVEVGKYLSTMHDIIQRYDDLMLSLVGPGGTTEENKEDCKASAVTCQGLEQELEQLQAPPEVATEQGGLAESLTLADDFFQSGGVTKHGFHGALDVTKQMQRISSEYHEAVLELIHARGLSESTDPFIADRASHRQMAARPNMKLLPKKISIRAGDLAVPGPAGGLSGVNAVAKSKSSESASLINGVDGSLGMSGLFNGLGGTDTNGLVDGLGMSSGLNGMVNGAGMSSGMSGMLNDTSTSAQSRANW
ncbi:MAG TPA: hypothetical protein V6C69_02220 [Trichormus sp.]